MDRRTFLKGSAAFTGGALAADKFLLGGLDRSTVSEQATKTVTSRKELARNKQIVQRYFDEVVNGRNLDLIDELVALSARNA